MSMITLSHEKLVDSILETNIEKPGKYSIWFNTSSLDFSDLLEILDIERKFSNRKIHVCDFTYENGEFTYEFDKKSMGQDDYVLSMKTLMSLLMSNSVIIEEFVEKKAKVYIYFDENLKAKTRTDNNDKIDTFNKQNHNYFLVDEYSLGSLEKQFEEHCKNMRLNLLSVFHPSMKDEEENE